MLLHRQDIPIIVQQEVASFNTVPMIRSGVFRIVMPIARNTTIAQALGSLCHEPSHPRLHHP
jgi:hypothetical protein